jgi:hypothetical protein
LGDSSSFELTVAAGPHERKNVPVRVELSRGQLGKQQIASVTMARANGALLPAQWTGPSLASGAAGEVHFVLPHLAAGELIQLKATLSAQPTANTAGLPGTLFLVVIRS